MSYNYNVISTLLHRSFMIHFSYRTLDNEILRSKQIFQSNRYPKNYVDPCIKRYLDKIFTNRQFICSVPKKDLLCVFYISVKNGRRKNVYKI